MSAAAWLVMAIVGFLLAGVALAAAIFMFIKMNIPAIIGDLTGKTVAREIKAMRDANMPSGDKKFRPSKVNMERGTHTEKADQTPIDALALKKAHESKRLDRITGELSRNPEKKKGGTVGLADTGQAAEGIGSMPTEALVSTASEGWSNNDTEVLSSKAAGLLNNNATEVLSNNAAGALKDSVTTVLSEGTTVLSEGTTVLAKTEELENPDITPVSFKVIKSEIVIHSDEVI